MALVQARLGVRQTAMYPVTLSVKPQQGDPFQVVGRATYGDFFAMFEAPFRSGGAWTHREDADQDNVMVLSANLADRLFPHAEAVGKTINLGNRDYRVIGVMRPWALVPRFYDVYFGSFGEAEDFYTPFSTAIDRQLETTEYACDATSLDWSVRLRSDCPWVQVWVELPTLAQVRGFRTFLQNYAAEQQRLGRFKGLPAFTLYDVTQWRTRST